MLILDLNMELAMDIKKAYLTREYTEVGLAREFNISQQDASLTIEKWGFRNGILTTPKNIRPGQLIVPCNIPSDFSHLAKYTN